MSDPIAMPAKLPTNIFQTGHYWLEYQHVARDGESPQMVADPRYWQHVAGNLKPRDVITVVALDNTYEMKLRVIDATKGALKLRVISFLGDELADQPADEAPNDQFSVSFNKADKWRVIDSQSKQVVSKDHATKEDAEHVVANLTAARKKAA